MAKIGIDARIWGVKHAGLGRYVEELVLHLQKLATENEYVIFCRKEDIDKIPDAKGWRKVTADIRHYSFAEQLKLVSIFNRERLDLLHVPHYNVPIFYRGKFIVTIHDLLWHDSKGLKVTTLPAPIYAGKYFSYRLVVRNAVRRAAKIITPTKAIKDDLLKKFSLQPGKVVVTYEGTPEVNSKVKNQNSKVLEKYKINQPYLLYVGSLYPHKNVEIVVRALKGMDNPPQLVVVSARNAFLEKFAQFVKKENAEKFVNLVGYISDEELAALYKNAQAFVFPTLSEGFGLPGLEAMQYETPVVCSGLLVLKEVYGEAAIYFDPRRVEDVSEKIKGVMGNKALRDKLIALGKKQAKKYSWDKMAKETVDIYKQALLQ